MSSGRPVCTVLVVEDDAAWAMLTAEAFREATPEVRVITVGGGAEALALLAVDSSPDVVLLDLHLPDVEGAEIITEIAAFDRDRDIVIVSASSSTKDRETAAALGVRAFLTKPTSFAALCALARDVVDGRYVVDGDAAR